jgi:ribose transport system substrate-binding protein
MDTVYGMADNQAVAAIRAADAASIAVGGGAKQLVVVGGNCHKEGIEAIKTGKMQATVSRIPTDLGVRTAEVIHEHFGGKKLPKEVLLPITTITKANEAQWEAPCTY